LIKSGLPVLRESLLHIENMTQLLNNDGLLTLYSSEPLSNLSTSRIREAIAELRHMEQLATRLMSNVSKIKRYERYISAAVLVGHIQAHGKPGNNSDPHYIITLDDHLSSPVPAPTATLEQKYVDLRPSPRATITDALLVVNGIARNPKLSPRGEEVQHSTMT